MTVSDASPLIVLARIGEFSLLEALFTPLRLPSAVYDDVVTRGRGRAGEPEVRAAIDAGWIQVEHPTRFIAPPYGPMRQGEIEALSLAVELGADLLMDEGPGRRRAQREGVYCRGTLDVLILARQAGHLAQVQPHLDALVSAGFYLDDALYREVLRRVGEAAPLEEDPSTGG